MTAPEMPASTAPDPIPPAAVFTVLAGALAIAYPYFDGLAAALAALLAISWWIRRPAPSVRRSFGLPPRAWAVLTAVAGWSLFLGDPPVLAAWRGVLLGAAGLPFWLWFRAPPAPPPTAEAP